MNERIRELAQQADFYADAMDIGGKNYIGLRDEYFAELIVRECAQAAAQTPCPYEDEFAKQTYGHTWDMACVESAKEIRKKFGVEE